MPPRVVDPEKSRLFVVATDGRLHTLDLSDGHAVIPPAQFVPAFSKMWSLNYVGGVLYTSISQGCNHAASGVAALDPDAPGRPVTRFFSAVSGAGVWGRGGVAVGFDGFIYGATGDAPFDPAAGEFGDTVFRLEPRTLQLAGYYTPSTWQYITRRDLDMGTSTPVVFRWKNHVLTAVGGKEGAIYVTDASQMSGPTTKRPRISPRVIPMLRRHFQGAGIWGLMTAWHDGAGATWLYVPSWGEPTKDARFPTSYGPVTNGSIMAFKVEAGAEGKPALQPAWMSSDIAVPEPAVLAGGVLFVLGTGENTQQVKAGDISQLLTGREFSIPDTPSCTRWMPRPAKNSGRVAIPCPAGLIFPASRSPMAKCLRPPTMGRFMPSPCARLDRRRRARRSSRVRPVPKHLPARKRPPEWSTSRMSGCECDLQADLRDVPRPQWPGNKRLTDAQFH